jgi:hypothetical protein
VSVTGAGAQEAHREKKKENKKRREGLNVKPRCKRMMKKQTKGWQEEIKRPATET